MRLSYIPVIFLISLTSCFRDVHRSLQTVDRTPSNNYEIKTMVGCCGCKALYYNVYKNHLLTEQFVVETACELYEPTKHIFETDAKGKIISFKSFVAVNDTSFIVPATELDKDAFKKLDSIFSAWTNATTRKIVFSDIKGFKDGGKTHFPVGLKMKKGLKYGM